MAEETVKQETTAEPERTFTQAEVDNIVGERLKREREKYADYADLKTKAGQFDELSKAHGEAQAETEKLKNQLSEMQKQIEKRNARDKVSAETGVPGDLLTGDTEEEMKKQAEKLLAFRGSAPKYPTVSDGGEVTKPGGGTTRQQFANWFEQNMNH